MQVVADHQHRAPHFAAHVFDLAVEGSGTGLIKPLRRLIEDQNVGFVQQGSRQQYSLELAAR